MSLDRLVSVPDNVLTNAQRIIKILSVIHRQTYLTCASVVTLTSNTERLDEPGVYPLDRTIPFQDVIIDIGTQILGKPPTFIRLIHFGSGNQMYTRECEATTFVTFISLPLFRRISTSNTTFAVLRQGQVIKVDAGATFRCTSDRPTDLVDDMVLLEVASL